MLVMLYKLSMRVKLDEVSYLVVVVGELLICVCCFFFFQAEDGIRDLVRSRGLGDVYKRQVQALSAAAHRADQFAEAGLTRDVIAPNAREQCRDCLLYTSDAADERSSVDLGGRRIIKKKKATTTTGHTGQHKQHKTQQPEQTSV